MPRVDTNFIIECSTRYLTSEQFVSLCGHVISSISSHNEHLQISIFKVIAAEFHLQLYTNNKSRSQT